MGTFNLPDCKPATTIQTVLASVSMKKHTLVGIDTGGTFTDIVVMDDAGIRICKVLSNPDDPSGPILEGLQRLGISDLPLHIIHGTTVGTNAVLEGKGAKVAYITSTGFADILSLGRQEREHVYRLEQPVLRAPVPDGLCLEVTTRIIADGSAIAIATDDELLALKQRLESLDVESVAINLLFSFLRPEEEERISGLLGEDWFVSCSSQVLPEVREYERGVATWLNASVGPLIARYLKRLSDRLPGARVAVMQSAGTTIASAQAAEHAVRLLLSGPAGGLSAARSIARQTKRLKLMSFDMGGTSTDVALLDDDIPLTASCRLARWPVSVPSVDIHTIGAGGGSIARLDDAGMLLVGPASAGASPGPACYGQGSGLVTVTDANLVLGRIPEDTLLGGYMPLDKKAAVEALSGLAANMGCELTEAAHGVLRLANEHMARALRVISVERGHDPTEYTLLCFGGAGGLHACELAELLNMPQAIIPAGGGVLSAIGMLVSEPGRDLSAAILTVLESIDDQEIGRQFSRLEDIAAEQLLAEGCARQDLTFSHKLELRYLGQSATIAIDWVEGHDHGGQFHAEHEKISGMALPHAVELVNIRLSARAPAVRKTLGVRDERPSKPAQLNTQGLSEVEAPSCERENLRPGMRLQGPLILTEPAATSWIKTGWSVEVDPWGNLMLSHDSTATAAAD